MPTPKTLARRVAFLGVGLGIVVAVLLRLPYLGVPLDADEGGYAYLARQWAGGHMLYRDVWVDRPQGLMLAYRALTSVAAQPWTIRVGAMLATALVVVGVSAAAWALGGRRAAVIAAMVTAVLGAVPHMQGFMFNGELAAAAFSSCAVACACWSLRRPAHMTALLLAAGVLGGIAITMKQSGFDGLAFAIIVAAASAGKRWRAVVAVVGGAALPIGAMVLQAALTSWSDWWYAVAGYRITTAAGSGGGLTGRWSNLVASVPAVWWDLLPLALLAILGVVLTLRRTPREWLPLIWFVLAFLGFFGGVFFFPHYWVQLVPPLCLLSALGLALLPARVALAAGSLAAVGVLIWTVGLTVATPAERDARAVPDGRLLANRQIAPWLDRHAAPADRIYAFVSSADLYFLAHRTTDFRYLWQANIEAVPGALDQLRAWLAGTDHPQWVVIYQDPDRIDPTGGAQRILDQRYRVATVIDGFQVLQALPAR